MKIIKAVNEPTDWVNNLVLVEKPDGSLRICIDPKELNKAIKHPHYAHPTTGDILSQMSGTKYFTKLDASNAYWQIELGEESSKLLTFNSLFGHYQFLRMPYGIHSASDVCQQMVHGDYGASNSQDDIIIWGSTQQELESRAMKVFSSVKKNGLKLNRNTSQFNKSEIIFWETQSDSHWYIS